MSALEFLTSLFAPDDCLGCGREGSLLCRACAADLPLPPGRCYECGDEITTPSIGCPACLEAAGFAAAQAVTVYAGIGRGLVGRLKFHGNQSAAKLMARTMTALPLPGDPLLVPMPATAEHVRQRGYDQAELIVRQLSRSTGRPSCRALARSGRQHQLGSDRHTRLEQLRAVLRVRKPVRGRHVLLIDDVLTTGSSLRAAAAVLSEAGAASVAVLVFAQDPVPLARGVEREGL